MSYEYVFIYAYVCLYVSRRNGSNDKKMEGTKIFYYKVVTLFMMWYGII